MTCDEDPEPFQRNYPDFRHGPDTPDFNSPNSPVPTANSLELHNVDVKEMSEEGCRAELSGLTLPTQEADIFELDSAFRPTPRDSPHEPTIDPRLLNSPPVVGTTASMAELQIKSPAVVELGRTLPRIDIAPELSSPFRVSPSISPITPRSPTEEMIDVLDVSMIQGTLPGQRLQKHMPSTDGMHSRGPVPFYTVPSATGQKLRIFGNSVEHVSDTNVRTSAFQISGDGHLAHLPSTTYGQALESLEMVYKGSAAFSFDQVMALVNLCLAVTTYFGNMQYNNLVYEDAVNWMHVLISGSDQARFSNMIDSMRRPASHNVCNYASKLPVDSSMGYRNTGSMMAKLKGGFIIQVCSRHLDSKSPSSRYLGSKVTDSYPSIAVRHGLGRCFIKGC